MIADSKRPAFCRSSGPLPRRMQQLPLKCSLGIVDCKSISARCSWRHSWAFNDGRWGSGARIATTWCTWRGGRITWLVPLVSLLEPLKYGWLRKIGWNEESAFVTTLQEVFRTENNFDVEMIYKKWWKVVTNNRSMGIFQKLLNSV